ncbi:MAG: hypothetical protein PHI12_15090 [Dehalococcoidales bacterium]|jgi:hypothetical protein|nr:hypothetical protein [Dehalococcoidales bacterium]
MGLIGRAWNDELGKEVDIYDTANSVPDDYVGTHVAIPEEIVPYNERFIGGLAYLREATTGSIPSIYPMPASHPTFTPDDIFYQQPTGALIPLLKPLLPFIVRILAWVALMVVCIVVAVTLMNYGQDVTEYTNPDDPDEVCKLVTIHTSFYAYTYDTCTQEVVDTAELPGGGGSISDITNMILTAGLVLGGGYIAIKYILPELMKKRDNKGG